MQDAELIERWTTELLLQLNADIVKAGKQRKPFPASPFGKTPAGNDDFRGFTLREKIVRASLEDYDFYLMRCDWAGCFIDCQVSRSVLDKIKLDGGFLRIRFEECSFKSASLSASSLGGSYRGCDFSKANLSKSKGRDVRFIECVFAGTNFRQAVLLHCSFEGCTFEGAKFHNSSLAGSTFKGLDPAGVDWDNAIMDHVNFS